MHCGCSLLFAFQTGLTTNDLEKLLRAALSGDCRRGRGVRVVCRFKLRTLTEFDDRGPSYFIADVLGRAGRGVRDVARLVSNVFGEDGREPVSRVKVYDAGPSDRLLLGGAPGSSVGDVSLCGGAAVGVVRMDGRCESCYASAEDRLVSGVATCLKHA